jgi:hypothetical protein
MAYCRSVLLAWYWLLSIYFGGKWWYLKSDLKKNWKAFSQEVLEILK